MRIPIGEIVRERIEFLLLLGLPLDFVVMVVVVIVEEEEDQLAEAVSNEQLLQVQKLPAARRR